MRISDWSSDVCSSDLGQRLLERRRVDDLLALEVLGGEGRDRDRHVLKALRRPLRGDDDILDTARILLSARVGGRVLRCGGIGLCEGWARRQERNCRGREQVELRPGSTPLLPRPPFLTAGSDWKSGG